MTREIGVHNEEALDYFLASEVFNQTVFILSEKFDEGMAALHLHCGWPIKELLSISSNCANCGHLLYRWDGKAVPKAGAITEDTRSLLLEKNRLDVKLYDAAASKWEAVRQRGGKQLADAMAEVQRQNRILQDYCDSKIRFNRADEWASSPGCLWLTLDGYEYELTVTPEGYVDWSAEVVLLPSHTGEALQAKTNITVKQMSDDFNGMYRRLIEGQQ